MKKIFGIFIIFFAVLYVLPVSAQVLDDEDISDGSDEVLSSDETVGVGGDSVSSSGKDVSVDETDADEAYFNELFSDYSETERDVTKIKTFDDAMDKASEFVKIIEDASNHPKSDEELLPLEGDISIGISRGSFDIYKNNLGRPECSFNVTVKSNLNRDIKTLGVNLIYPFARFAFIFRNIKPNGMQEQPMRTIGYACYQMSEVPDLDVNYCKIRTASGRECIQRLKWVKNIEPQKIEEEEEPLLDFDDISFDSLEL